MFFCCIACHRDWQDENGGERRCPHISDGPNLDGWLRRRKQSPDERRAYALRAELFFRGMLTGAFLDQPHPFAFSYAWKLGLNTDSLPALVALLQANGVMIPQIQGERVKKIETYVGLLNDFIVYKNKQYFHCRKRVWPAWLRAMLKSGDLPEREGPEGLELVASPQLSWINAFRVTTFTVFQRRIARFIQYETVHTAIPEGALRCEGVPPTVFFWLINSPEMKAARTGSSERRNVLSYQFGSVRDLDLFFPRTFEEVMGYRAQRRHPVFGHRMKQRWFLRFYDSVSGRYAYRRELSGVITLKYNRVTHTMWLLANWTTLCKDTRAMPAGDRRLQRFAPAGVEQLQIDGAVKAGADAAAVASEEEMSSSDEDQDWPRVTPGGPELRVLGPV